MQDSQRNYFKGICIKSGRKIKSLGEFLNRTLNWICGRSAQSKGPNLFTYENVNYLEHFNSRLVSIQQVSKKIKLFQFSKKILGEFLNRLHFYYPKTIQKNKHLRTKKNPL